MSEKDPKSPATTSLAYDVMKPQWDQIETVLGGTATMRAAGQEFLPMHAQEEDDAYQERLDGAVLFNITKKTLNMWTGKPFSKKTVPSDDMPDQIRQWGNDIDLKGNNFAVFLRSWFEGGLKRSFYHVMVDKPRIQKTDKPRTKADDKKDNIRPYWVLIDPRDVIDADSELRNGREVITHLRVREVEAVRSGFATVYKDRIRMYEDTDGGPVKVTLFEKEERKVAGKEIWKQIDSYDMGINFIPLVTFYADREDFMVGISPLYDLSFLNIRHFQSDSDQTVALTVARFPILAMSGAADEDEELVIGPRKWLHCPDPQGRFYYVENQGHAIAAGETDKSNIEERMATYGVEALRKRPTNVTATGRILDHVEHRSPLEDMALRFEDAVNLALEYTAVWAKISTAGKMDIHTDFSLSTADSVAVELLKEARRNQDISRRKFLKRMVEINALPEDFDLDENDEELKKEEAEKPKLEKEIVNT